MITTLYILQMKSSENQITDFGRRNVLETLFYTWKIFLKSSIYQKLLVLLYLYKKKLRHQLRIICLL